MPAGNPVTGSTLSHTHSTGTCASTCSTMSRRCGRVGDRRPGDPVGLQQPGEVVPGGADDPVGGQVMLERGPQHRPRPLRVAGQVEAAGGLVPAGELRRRGGLARPGEGVQQHDGLGVERPVQRQQRLIPAEKPRIRRPRHPARPAPPSSVLVSAGVSLISGAARSGGRSSTSGAASYTTGTAQSCNGTGAAPICRTGSAASARRAAVAAWPRDRPASRWAYRSATNWAAVTT